MNLNNINKNKSTLAKERVNKGQISYIIKTLFSCNMRCLYCYEGKQTEKSSITFSTLENFFNKISTYHSSNSFVKLIWFGGEPLLMGLDFFKRIIKIQKKYAIKTHFINVIQTNGLLLSSEFIDFFTSNNFHIGLSLDGPPIIHNSQRLLPNGKGSFDKVFKAIEIIRSLDEYKSKGKFSALVVFSRNTLEHLDTFYDFFKNHRINFKINPLLHRGNAEEFKAKNLYFHPHAFGAALVYLFDKWLSEKQFAFSIEPFSGILNSLITGKPKSCTFTDICHDRYLCIDPEGNIGPCGRWNKNDFNYGNINKDSIADALSSSDCERYKNERSKYIYNCVDCQHHDLCHGGCAFSGYMKRKSLADSDYYCEGYKILFDHIKNTVKEKLFPDIKFQGEFYGS